jgi:dolichol kinase
MGLTLSLSSIVYFVIPILMKKLVFNLFGCIVFYIFAFLLNIEAYSLITNFLYPVNLSLLSKEQEYKIDLNKQDELRELATE